MSSADEQWPLQSTSTIFMSGKAVYNLRRHGRPGIIASVEMFPADADAFREAIADRVAEAVAAERNRMQVWLDSHAETLVRDAVARIADGRATS